MAHLASLDSHIMSRHKINKDGIKMEDYDVQSIKTPPHSIEAEQSVLGGLLIDNEAYEKITGVVSEDDFYFFSHRIIFKHICRLIDKNHPVDIVILAEDMDKAGSLKEVGGIQYLGALVQNIPSAANIQRYANIVRERAILRKLIETCGDISGRALMPQLMTDSNAGRNESRVNIVSEISRSLKALAKELNVKMCDS